MPNILYLSVREVSYFKAESIPAQAEQGAEQKCCSIERKCRKVLASLFYRHPRVLHKAEPALTGPIQALG